jgi:hypothetical protein
LLQMHKRRLAAAKPTCCGCQRKRMPKPREPTCRRCQRKRTLKLPPAKLTADASESRSEAAGRAKLSADAKGKQTPKPLKEPNLVCGRWGSSKRIRLRS